VYKFQTSRGARQPRRRDRDAEGIEGEVNVEGVSPPHRLGSLGSIVSSPAGFGAQSRQKTSSGVFYSWKKHT